MTKVTKPIAGVKHIKAMPINLLPDFIKRNLKDLEESRCKAYKLRIP